MRVSRLEGVLLVHIGSGCKRFRGRVPVHDGMFFVVLFLSGTTSPLLKIRFLLERSSPIVRSQATTQILLKTTSPLLETRVLRSQADTWFLLGTMNGLVSLPMKTCFVSHCTLQVVKRLRNISYLVVSCTALSIYNLLASLAEPACVA